MTLPLVVLGILSVIAGYPFFADRFLTLPAEQHHPMVPILSLCAFAAGAGLAIVLYSGRSKDPVRIPLLANKFYIDEIYAAIIRNTQDLLARISGKFDRLVLDGGVVRGLCGGGVYATGFVLRLFQVGNLQGYAFLFGLGVVALIYFMIFK